MSKTTSDLLFRFIKALTSTEKRYFKLFASRHTIGNKNEYLKMFEAFDRMSTYNETDLRKSFRQLKARNSFAIAKNRLYETILRSLDSYHSESSIDVQLRSQLHYVEILFKKSLYDECGKLLQKAKKLAVKYEKHSVVLDAHKWEKRLIEKDGYTTTTESEINNLLEDELLCVDMINNYCEFWNIKSRLFFMLSRYGKVRDISELQNFKTIIDNVLLKSEASALSYETRYLYYHIYSAYFFGIGNYPESYDYIKKHLELMEKNPNMLKEEPNKYFAAVTNMIYICTQLGKFKEIHKWVVKLNNIPEMLGKKTTEDLEIKLFSSSNSALLSLYIQTGDFKKAELLIPAIETGLKKYENKINKIREAFLYFNISIVYFSTGKFNEALKWINKLLNDHIPDVNEDIYTLARLLDLAIHLEIGNNDLIPYTLRSVQRYLNKRKRMYRFESVFVDFVKVIARAKTERDKKLSYAWLKDQLLTIYNDPFEKPVFEYFDFLTWVESKVSNKTFAELTVEKVTSKMEVTR
jgi:hypothetical protein